jgi:hypothetical protein
MGLPLSLAILFDSADYILCRSATRLNSTRVLLLQSSRILLLIQDGTDRSGIVHSHDSRLHLPSPKNLALARLFDHSAMRSERLARPLKLALQLNL